MKLSTAIHGFKLHWKQSPRTIDLYAHCLSRLVAYLGDPDIETITHNQVAAWYRYMGTEYQPGRFSRSTARLSPAMLDNYWIAMRSFFTWVEETLHIQRPDNDIQRPRYEQPLVVPFSEIEIKRIVAACEYTKLAVTGNRKRFKMKRPTADRDKAMILLLLDTGIRLGELLRLQIKDVNLENEEIIIHPFSTGKKSKPRIIPIGALVKKALWIYLYKSDTQYRDGNQLLFDLRASSISSLFSKLSERTGIKNIHAHRFRHTFAIQFLRNGGNIFALKKLLGHSTLKMVNYYLAIADTDLHDSHRLASPVDRWSL